MSGLMHGNLIRFQFIFTMLHQFAVAARIYFLIPITFIAVIPQQLDQHRFLKAARLLLHSYPSLGGRLDSTPEVFHVTLNILVSS